jgi:starvation-inducible DNA-binding protein
MNKIGLKKEYAIGLSKKLNSLLADYQVFYMNTRGFHWNIKGDKFFELHVKFEELYNNLILKIDEIAERILTLGETPLHSYSEYLQLSDIQTITNVTESKKSVSSILDSFETVLLKQREILSLSSEASDEGTSSMISDYIREQEKLVWMYEAFSGK